MISDPSKTMSKEAAGAANLMVHPAAGVAAMSALGIGMASQAFGVWLGGVEAAVQASQRMMTLAKSAAPVALKTEPKAAARKAKAATRILMEEAQSFARDMQAEVKLAPAKPAPAKPAPLKLVPNKPAEVLETPAAPPAAPALVQPKVVKKPAKPDDLKAISGVGPKLEAVLNGLGIWTYRQIASWSEAEIGWVEGHFGFVGRISRDGWVEQANKLAGRKTKN